MEEIKSALERFPIFRANVGRSSKSYSEREALETKLQKIEKAIETFS